MRQTRISGALRNKFDDWVETINDINVRRLVRKNSIITGGCIPSMLLDENVNDFDVYFTNIETVNAVCMYYIHSFEYDTVIRTFSIELESDSKIYVEIPSEGIARRIPQKNEIDNKLKYLPKVITENAITLHDDIQLIIRFVGNVEEIHKNFDYVHCTCTWASKDDSLYLPKDALVSILTKELIYRGSKYPLSSIIRSRKFITRGWTINGGQYLTMCFQVSELNLKDVNVLKDQLIGVDTTYFAMLIARINADKCDITHDYIVKLVDEIFG